MYEYGDEFLMNKELWIIDAYSLIYSSYWALSRNPMTDPNGDNVSSIVLFLNTLLALNSTQEGQVEKSIIIAMDSPGKNFRHDLYSDYKANRPPTPEDLRPQLPRLIEILEALKLPILRESHLEADDLIASAVEHYHREGRDVHILSKDKDLMQLVRPGVSMHRPTTGTSAFELYDSDAVYEKMGVWPRQILDYLSLVGDSSDNIPGVQGIGPKSAVRFLDAYENLDGIYEHIAELKSAQQKKLQAGKASAYLSRELASLKSDEPIAIEEAAIDWEAALPFMKGLGALQLAYRIAKLVGVHYDPKTATWTPVERSGDERGTSQTASDRTAQATATAGAAREGNTGAINATGARAAHTSASGADYSDESLPAYRRLGFPASWSEKGRCKLFLDLASFRQYIDERLQGENPVLVLDLETTGLRALQEDILGIAAVPVSGAAEARTLLDAKEHGPAQEGAYLVVRGADEDRPGAVRNEALRDYMQSLFDREDLCIVGQNFGYDAKVFHHFGVKARWDFDTMIASWVLSATPRYNMDLMAKLLLDYTPISFKEMSKGLPLFEVAPELVGDYAAEDGYVTYRLYRVLDKMLSAEPSQKKRFEKIEMPVARVLNRMETYGIRFDSSVLDEELGVVLKRHEEVEAALHLLLGEETNLNSPQQLQEVLFKVKGLPKPRAKGSTGYSTSRSVLEWLKTQTDDPSIPLLLEYRVLQKLKSGYIDALPTLVSPLTGRIHTNYLITGTDTGRLSSCDPNLQNIPIKTEEGRRIRSCFKPEPGYRFLSVDYAQIELVVLAYLSADPVLCEAFRKGIDVHAYTAGLLFGVDSDYITSEQRRIAKTVNFGVVYGQSAFSLAGALGISNGEAKSFINEYFARYSQVRSLFETIVQEARLDGYVETLCRRRRLTPGLNHENYRLRASAERAAINSVIQGSAADIMKLAMLSIAPWAEEQGDDCRMLLQVHDELLFEVREERAEELMAEIVRRMEQVYDMDVPLRVSAELGTSWGALH